VDTLITIVIVAAAAAWAGLAAWRRATAKASSCAGGCAGCPGARSIRTTASPCPEGSDTAFPRAEVVTGVPLPSLSERKG
jgi:hypothetical protein